jgi:acyl-CoA thioester hydrolase
LSFPVVVRVSVLWSDLDAYGHVNNAVFFRWFEQARMSYLEQCGMLQTYERNRIGAILHSTSCRFRAPVFHPDEIEIGTRVTEVGADRFTMAYTARATGRDEVVGEGTAVVVCFDYAQGQKAPLPASVRGRIHEMEYGRPSGPPAP